MKLGILLLPLILTTGCSLFTSTNAPIVVHAPENPAVHRVGRMLYEAYPPSAELRKVADRITELHEGLERAKARKYANLFIKYSEKYNLDLNMVIHVAFIESRFEEDAISRTGDYGIMQINWRAHRRALTEMGIDRQRLLEPDVNIDYGCYLLSEFAKGTKSLYGIIRRYSPRRAGYYTRKLQNLMSKSDL